AADADELGLAPLAIRVGEQVTTLRRGPTGLEATTTSADPAGPAGATDAPAVTLDPAAFADWVHEQRTGLGLAVAGRVEGDPDAVGQLCAWDPVLRSVLDGRPLYRSGDVELLARDGSPLDLDQRFALGRDDEAAAHFLAEAGFVLLTDVFTD